MIRHLRTIYLVISIIVVSCKTTAQITSSPEVIKSNKVIQFEGKKFYVHIVKKGETLYSISKVYQVSQEDIIKHNITAASGLQPDQLLRIPESQPQINTTANKTLTYQEHIVEAQQTLFFISKKYDITVEDLKTANPELLSTSIQIGQKLKIPIKKNISVITEPITLGADTGKYILHTVIPQETLYSISRQYQISIEKILQLNPQVAEEGLKANESIRIPQSHQFSILSDSLTKANNNFQGDSLLLVKRKVRCDSIALHNSDKSPLQVSLLLPFFSHITEQHQEEPSELKEDEQIATTGKIQSTYINATGARFMEFYCGSLLALEELKNQGISVNLHIFDTETSKGKPSQLLQNPQFVKSSLVIGPVFTDQVKALAQFSNLSGYHLISPVSTREEALINNKNVFMINTARKVELQNFAIYISKFKGYNIILVHNKDEQRDSAISAFKKELNVQLFTQYNTSEVKFKEINYNNKYTIELDSALNDKIKNAVIVLSNNEVFVTNFVRYLNGYTQANNKSYTKTCSIELFGINDYTRYQGIDAEYLHNCEFRCFSPFYVNYNDPATRKFMTSFKHQYGFEPGKMSNFGFNFAMLGYDLMYQFVKNSYRYRSTMCECSSVISYNGLLTNYTYSRESPQQGMMNIKMNIIKYNKDFSIELEK